ncbi:LysR substrate-binding domain-containing protein [Pseudorhodoplanes sinuspersici]|uniref:LysR family transcriptional regulator n=1 Tax=Pseudorhodoplanes sinuspersici TaxID=1235591 RepID=A0A1W6ZLC6_9HYPH|nr:LysR substrate-binding domain-containing protein [Pseudorhodoplanes sinuspersici]ARP98233.1 LysR family transcriptional regulator [Pseudorhodoplanes sinuspersici]RKE68011.1 LysR family transcriptional regulator [Pseudorhodoplanes sinuspersici]
MTLDQLRIFVGVAEREHMTRAAEALRLTQSAVSGAISALENRHGVVLFHRIGRRVELTQDGRIFLEEARAVLRSAASAEQSLRELRGLKRGAIKIHASQTTASYWLPERLAHFRARHPDIMINVTIGNTTQVVSAIVNGAAEIGFVEDTVQLDDLIAWPVHQDRLTIVVHAKHPWAKLRRRLEAAEIGAAEWVMRERGSGTRSVFEDALRQDGIKPELLRICLELPSNEAVRAAVEAGAGATAMSHAVVRSGLASGQLSAVQFRAIERSFSALMHRERRASLALREFIEELSPMQPPSSS